ncbi:MAG: DUF1489 domain-containing protein [Sphingomonas bacterium]|nr:DUF1489 domain-containing protein [Sphingomonas bacterium]
MPKLHLTKVAVGVASVEALENRIARRVTAQGEVRVPTRMRPKRMAELIGGSLHWIVKHRIVARQVILRFDDRSDGRIDIVCSGDLLAVTPSPKRAHQGWRYLEDDAVPGDGEDADGMGALPSRMYAKLAGLGLV